MRSALEDHFLRVLNLHDLPVDFICNGLEDYRLEDFKAINLYRIIQEALHNIVKHSQAKNVRIQIDANPSGINLSIEDDGCGFDVEEFVARGTDGKHLGLAGMAERVDLLNGEFEISSTPGKGTKIGILIS